MQQTQNAKHRYSNIEALRILSMFLVLIVHADFFSLGEPSLRDINEKSLSSFVRYFLESLSIVCVNVFILISGWFGIRPKAKSFGNFIFQCLFFLIGIYIVCLIFGKAEFNLKNIAGCFFLLKWNWFIKAYIGLYILSPILNAFADSATEKQIRLFLIFFFVFQTIYSWMSGAAQFFEAGYSTLSFIGLYMLSRYVKLYKPKIFTLSSRTDFIIYLTITLLITLIAIVPYNIVIWINAENTFYHTIASFISAHMFRYDNPLVIMSSLYLLLGFSKVIFENRIINWIAASSFAVFLLHTNPNLCNQYFIPAVQFIYNWGGQGVVSLFTIFAFLILIFICAVLVDQLRIVSWNYLSKIIWKAK